MGGIDILEQYPSESVGPIWGCSLGGAHWSVSISQIYTGFLPMTGGLSLRNRISSVIVAVNSNVCRPCSAEGTISRHSDRSSAKESVRSLSASSRTTNLVRRSPHMVSSPEDLM